MDDASIAGPNHAAGIFLECFSYFWQLLRCTYAAEGPKLGYAGLLLWFNRDLGSLVQARVTGVATLRFATSGETNCVIDVCPVRYNALVTSSRKLL
jgi:hypothetical protein